MLNTRLCLYVISDHHKVLDYLRKYKCLKLMLVIANPCIQGYYQLISIPVVEMLVYKALQSEYKFVLIGETKQMFN